MLDLHRVLWSVYFLDGKLCRLFPNYWSPTNNAVGTTWSSYLTCMPYCTNTRGIQYFCPFAVKERSTTVIFLVCISFHQSNILDDMHKVLAVFTSHKLCFGILLSIPLICWSAADLVLYWHWNYLPERASYNFGNHKNSHSARYC